MGLSIDNQVANFDFSHLDIKPAFIATEKRIGESLAVTLIFTSLDDMFHLNNQLRNKASATDVLSLPVQKNEGEVYICPEYILKAGYDNKRFIHLWVHGLLHIAGYTHDHDDDFLEMSSHETAILNSLDIEDPYAE